MRNIQILHFNDAYHLSAQKKEPVGGVARFATAIKEFRAKYGPDSSCVLFSGDLFNPSVESSVSKGRHMATYQILNLFFTYISFFITRVFMNFSYRLCFNNCTNSKIPAINNFGVDVACLGNHDFDFGLPNLKALVRDSNFPWLLSNVLDSESGNPVADAKIFHILEKNGLKLGIIGLVEK